MQGSEGRRSEQSSGDTWWDTVLANLEDAGLIATPPPLAAWPGAFPPLPPPPCGPLLVQLSPCHPRHSSWGRPRGGSPFHLVSIHSLWQTGEGQ